MKMKQIIFSFLLLVSVNIFAQDTTETKRRNPEKVAAMELKMVKKRITTLEQTQNESLTTVYDVYATALGTAFNKTNRREKMQATKMAVETKNEAVKKVLNEMQYKEFEAITEEMKAKIKEKRGERKQ
jgi:activator of 2-hydroxyglutaryl-CoA dehydratase